MNQRKYKKSLIMTILVLAMLLPTFASHETAYAKGEPELNEVYLHLFQGETYQLKVKNAGTNSVKWKSSNKKVATVTSNGKVKVVAKPKKECKIYAIISNSEDEETLTCTIEVVKQKYLDSYIIYKSNFTYSGKDPDGKLVEGVVPEYAQVIQRKNGYYCYVQEGHNYDVTVSYISLNTKFYLGKKLPNCFKNPAKVTYGKNYNWKISKKENDGFPAINWFINSKNECVFEKARDYTDKQWKKRMKQLGY